ncbi:MAG: DNA repair protein RecO [Candidatus Moranbacteria bacterium]|nr:DNA repair protein RecO [Candidatus Moranbacteria bacterium]
MEMKYSGIIIGKRDVREVDRLYVVYTLEQGRLSMLGKGVRKASAKLAGNLETLSHVEIYMSKGRGQGNITGAIALDSFLSLKADFSALGRVFYAVSYFNKFITQEEKDEKSFEFLLEYLRVMDALAASGKGERKYDAVTFGFLFKFLENVGYGIDANFCSVCEGKITGGGNYFSAKRGGIICGNCRRQEGGTVRIDDHSVKLIRIFYKNRIASLSKLEVSRRDISNLKIVFQEFANWIK